MKEYLKIVVVAVVAGLLSGAVVALVGGNKSQPVGQTGTRFANGISADSTSPTAGQVRGTTLSITSTSVLTGGATVGTNGSALDVVRVGICYPFIYGTSGNSITASSSATVDCSAANGSLSALTGVSSGDTPVLNATSSISTAGNGLVIEAVQASSTAGYITFVVRNNTGAAFTWSGVATPTLRFLNLSPQ